ncbi:DUF2484 family protein [Sulfitobacter aestuariivivens]|uniref:DUF2484 family protein n=1 Tax=Sulfitobacter aestuariivivens TaxID=2766981 RepID=A0A927D566_9RHOB|nr:DUF2484 family protein [Sulfitobacter aestuariivivens]MBD3663647.1 DUF2484 family protein [Sulfitobacter aestuariivivens]
MMLVWFSIGWVFASVVVAMLPMRHQYFPGIALLLAAPVLIVLVGLQFGWIFSLLAVFAFVSMFRNPLKYIWAKARGQNPQLPREFASKKGISQ